MDNRHRQTEGAEAILVRALLALSLIDLKKGA